MFISYSPFNCAWRNGGPERARGLQQPHSPSNSHCPLASMLDQMGFTSLWEKAVLRHKPCPWGTGSLLGQEEAQIGPYPGGVSP